MSEDTTDTAVDYLESNEFQVMLEIQNDMLGSKPSILGRKLRPVKLSSLALLQKTNNELVSGKLVEDCKNLILDSCKFVLFQSVPLKEALRLAESPEELNLKAYELADEVDPSQLEEFTQLVLGMINGASKNRVEPIPQKDAREELTIESVGE
jgi:hypothetical protein